MKLWIILIGIAILSHDVSCYPIGSTEVKRHRCIDDNAFCLPQVSSRAQTENSIDTEAHHNVKRYAHYMSKEELEFEQMRETDDIEDPEIPAFHVWNKRLWKQRYFIIPLYLFVMFKFVSLLFLIACCGKACTESCSSLKRTILEYYDLLLCRDRRYRTFCQTIERMGFDPPPYEHFLQIKGAFGIPDSI